MADDNGETVTISAADVADISNAKVTAIRPEDHPDVVAIDEQMAALREQKESAQQGLRELQEKRDAKVAEQTAAKKLADMSPAERKALGIPEPQSVSSVGGIESKETSGVPGN